MSQQEQQIQEVEASIEYCRKRVALGETLERLLHNKDFIQIIDEGYFTQEARRLTLLSADPNLPEASVPSVLRSIQAIGELHTYINRIRQDGHQAALDLAQSQIMLEQVSDPDYDPDASGLAGGLE